MLNAFICDGIRTPFGRHAGSLSKVRPDDMLGGVIKKIVSKVGVFCIDLFKEICLGTVMKHIPGLGLSNKDSHFKTPEIRANKNELCKKDFKPFKKNKSYSFFIPWGWGYSWNCFV